MAQPILIPRNRTPFETAVEAVDAERYPLPTHLPRAMWSPDECPADLLGFMAYQFSVDVWDEAWPELKKREVVRNALHLHRLKTTPAGIKAHVALTGAEVVRIIRPPAKGFLRGAMTEAQRLEWLDSLPQVRVYPFATREIAVGRHFHTGPGARKQFHSASPSVSYAIGLLAGPGAVLGGLQTTATTGGPLAVRGFLRPSRGKLIYGKRATYYDRGAEFEATIAGDTSDLVTRIYLRRQFAKRQWHGVGAVGAGYLTASVADVRTVSLRISDDAQAFAVERGLEPVDVRPKRIAQKRIAPNVRSFFGRSFAGRFMLSTYGPLLIYDRIALNDPDRLGARRKVRTWHGFGRFGIPDYTAELRIRVPMERGRRRSGKWHGAGFRQAADMSPMHKAIEAVRVSKAFRDTVLIDTATTGIVQFDGRLRFGEFEYGQIKEVE